jgi:O-antigen ligase
LLLPLVVVTRLLLPGSVATLKAAFLPEGGLVNQQAVLARNADPLLAGGRIRQLGPMLREAGRRPLLGQGFGTRQTGFNNPLRNAPILDNQWLGLLLESGIVGVAGWATLIFGASLRLGRASRRRAGPDGWLEVGVAASLTGFGVGMFTYDSLSFVQEAFFFWIVVALAASLLLTDAENVGAHGEITTGSR